MVFFIQKINQKNKEILFLNLTLKVLQKLICIARAISAHFIALIMQCEFKSQLIFHKNLQISYQFSKFCVWKSVKISPHTIISEIKVCKMWSLIAQQIILAFYHQHWNKIFCLDHHDHHDLVCLSKYITNVNYYFLNCELILVQL